RKGLPPLLPPPPRRSKTNAQTAWFFFLVRRAASTRGSPDQSRINKAIRYQFFPAFLSLTIRTAWLSSPALTWRRGEAHETGVGAGYPLCRRCRAVHPSLPGVLFAGPPVWGAARPGRRARPELTPLLLPADALDTGPV